MSEVKKTESNPDASVNVVISAQTLSLKVKKLHPDAKAPSKAHADDAGLDLTAVSREWDRITHCWVYDFGIAMEIPQGHAGFIFPRSSSCKTPVSLTNCVGVVDAGYRGSVKAYFREHLHAGFLEANLPKAGERVAQMVIMPFPAVEVTVVDELSPSLRGTNGWGSSGKI